MNICILGGTGLVGQALKTQLSTQHTVKTYGRSAFDSEDTLLQSIRDAQIIIFLSGANIGQRWNKSYKQQLWDSRVKTAQMLSAAIKKLDTPPQRIFSTSAIGFYPETDCQQPLSEEHTQPGNGFLADLSVAWEAEAQTFCPPENLVITRFGVVLDKSQGALAKMLPAFKLGLGGPVAGGKQCFSWVHIKDLVKAFKFLISHPELHGVFNITSPTPMSQHDFAKQLAQTLNRPCVIPLPLWQLKLMFGEGAQVLTHSSAVIPKRLLENGFEFSYPTAQTALQDLLR